MSKINTVTMLIKGKGVLLSLESLESFIQYHTILPFRKRIQY